MVIEKFSILGYKRVIVVGKEFKDKVCFRNKVFRFNNSVNYDRIKWVCKFDIRLEVVDGNYFIFVI